MRRRARRGRDIERNKEEGERDGDGERVSAVSDVQESVCQWPNSPTLKCDKHTHTKFRNRLMLTVTRHRYTPPSLLVAT